MGHRFRDDTWLAPDSTGGSPEADALHALLVHRADQLEGCIEGSAEEHEFSAIVSAIVAYEKKRWPEGRRAAKVSCLAPFQFSDFPLRPPSPKTRMLIHSAHAKCMGSNPQICVFFPSNLRPRCLFTCFGAMVTMRSQLT
jgi:hypothetical protein